MYTSCFFFFQAEDGIRDHCVTGVQTCALPIFARLAHFRIGKPDDVKRRQSRPEEIGRASCRERVSISVVAVSLKKKKEQHQSRVCRNLHPPPKRISTRARCITHTQDSQVQYLA